MKIISLNIWGGKLFNPLLDFIKTYSKEVDLFCLQEVYHSTLNKKIDREMRSNLFMEISQILSDFQGFFAPTLNKRDLLGNVDFNLEIGLAIFARKSLIIKNQGDIFVYRNRNDKLINNDYKTIPRNLQYLIFENNGQDYLICHFHGIWYQKTKLDTNERLDQSKKIKEFLDNFKGKKILCGDFNLLPNTKSLEILEEGMRNLIKDYSIPTTRNHFYEREEKYADYFLVSKDIRVINFESLQVTVSDHLPSFLDFS